jgi:hypothetical protein
MGLHEKHLIGIKVLDKFPLFPVLEEAKIVVMDAISLQFGHEDCCFFYYSEFASGSQLFL